MTATEILAALAAPFDPKLVSWRVGSMSKDKSKAKALCYIDARDVMRRLDAIMGADWQCEYVPMPNGTTCCKISLRIDGEWRCRSNGAGATDIEGEKGGFSDAFKRAAVLWGIGQYLYDVDSPWVKVNEWKQIEEGEMPRLRSLLAKQNPETRAPEQRPARQEPEPSAAMVFSSEKPAPVDPKKEALDRQTQHATRTAELQKAKHEDAKRLFRSHSTTLKNFQDSLDKREKPFHAIRRDWETFMQTLKASAHNMLPDDQRVLRGDVAEVLANLKHAEKFETVAA